MGSLGRTPHLVIAGVEPWGHARPLCAFAAKVALTREVHVTLFTTPRILDRVKAEISRSFEPADDRQKLVRIIAIDNAVKVEGVPDIPKMMAAETERYLTQFVATYAQLLDEKPVTCASTHTEYPALSAPTMLVVDFILGPLTRVISNLPNNKAQLVAFCSGMASFAYLAFAPSERGGRGGLRNKVFQTVKDTGRSVTDVAEEALTTYTGEIIQIPGFPKMHHWEFDPQDTSFMIKGLMGPLFLGLFETFDLCSGLIITSPEAYEPVTITATKEWWGEMKRKVWAIGPLMPSPSSKEAIAGEEAQSANFGEIKHFMDNILSSNGENSMLYISFGSAFWPPTLDALEAFIDVIIEKRIPFIFSYGSPFGQLSNSFKAKVQDSGIGLLSTWSPQQTILAHPVLGWFVTHCGHNSTLEAVSFGVPMICWPFHADQPANATHLTENHDVAYELFEVRTGNGLKPIYRTGKAPAGTPEAVRTEAHEVLDKAFSEDGARKRANVKKLKEKIDAAWNKGGSADVDMAALLDSL